MTDAPLPPPPPGYVLRRSVVITPELQSAMIRDLIGYGLSRWYIITTMIGVVVLFLFIAISALGDLDLVDAALAVCILIVGIALVLAIVIPVRRGIVVNYPVGFTAAAHVGASTLSSTTALGTTQVRFAAFRRVRVTRSSVLLLMRTPMGGVGVMPRALFADHDLGRLTYGVDHA